jgi:exopolysaccharide biosynthesis protein
MKKKKTGRKLFIIGSIFFPLLICFYIVSLHSNRLIPGFLSIPLLYVGVFMLVMEVTGAALYFTGKDKLKKKFKKPLVVIFFILLTAYTAVGFGFTYKLYYSGKDFKEWLVTTAMTTMSHQYLANWFYSDYEIASVLSQNVVIESAEDTNADLIKFKEIDFNKTTFADEYDKAVLTKDKGNDLYKIIDVSGKNYKGKLAVVYDPSKVKIGVSNQLGTNYKTAKGQYINEIAARYKAVLAINGGGFIDPGWNTWGGVPHGITISQGKLVSNNAKASVGGGIVGFTKDNKLVLTHYTAQQAIKAGIRDCVEFGPFLVVNGKSSYIKGNGGWGVAPRTAIGQRADGIVLLLTIDGRQQGSAGVDMNELSRIMVRYGAINAANMDGGTSTAMELNGQIISNPRNGNGVKKTRPVPTAWIVTP